MNKQLKTNHIQSPRNKIFYSIFFFFYCILKFGNSLIDTLLFILWKSIFYCIDTSCVIPIVYYYYKFLNKLDIKEVERYKNNNLKCADSITNLGIVRNEFPELHPLFSTAYDLSPTGSHFEMLLPKKLFARAYYTLTMLVTCDYRC